MKKIEVNYTVNGEQKQRVAYMTDDFRDRVEHEGNELTEWDILKNRQRPNERWDFGPTYVIMLFFEDNPEGAQLYLEATTGYNGEYKGEPEPIGLRFLTPQTYGIPFTVNITTI